MNKLKEICAKKKEHVAVKKAETTLEAIKEHAAHAPASRGFKNALQKTYDACQVALIAEVKKASPSKGLIRENFDPQVIANSYKNAGASCLSVLTDEPYFQGCDTYLTQVQETVNLPLLRKDFMIDPYQIYESRALGADCILLILAALSDDEALEMHKIAQDLGMDTLAETHDAEEVRRALKLDNAIIGVNSRNLKTLEVTLETAISLCKNIPDNRMKIAESGIRTPDDIRMLQEIGYHGFLIGESLMRQNDIEAATRNILSTH